jgi:hypothetical protein
MSISINKVYETTMFLLSKNNYGAITPTKFNSFAELAVSSIFESLFYSDNLDAIKKANHLTNDQYADLKRMRDEQIDVYSKYSSPSTLTFDAVTGYWNFVGTDLYRAINLSLVNSQSKKKTNIEINLKTRLNYAVNSNINAPNIYFPEYCRVEEAFDVYPKDITGHFVELLYIRKPKTPKWDYTVVGVNPLFNAGNSVNIDLHQSLYERVIVKIMQYCGVSLKENDVIQVADGEEAKITQKQS